MDGTAKVKVTTAQNGSVIRGLYRLTFPGPGSHGYETWNLAYNATAAQVKGALIAYVPAGGPPSTEAHVSGG